MECDQISFNFSLSPLHSTQFFHKCYSPWITLIKKVIISRYVRLWIFQPTLIDKGLHRSRLTQYPFPRSSSKVELRIVNVGSVAVNGQIWLWCWDTLLLLYGMCSTATDPTKDFIYLLTGLIFYLAECLATLLVVLGRWINYSIFWTCNK